MPIETSMDGLLSLPTWALLALLAHALAVGFMDLHIAATAANSYTSLHDFKIEVITLRNAHLKRLKALYSGNDPTGAAASIFDDDDVEILSGPQSAPDSAQSKAAA